MMAFGGGALVEALSLELFGHVRMFQRQGEPSVMWVAIAAAWMGGVLYYGLERMLNNRGAFLRSKFYLERAIRQYHDALRSQTAAWEEGFKRAWVRDHAKRQPDDGLPAGDEYITELAAAQAAAAGSAAAVAAQMAVDAGQPTEVVISAGEAAGLAVSDAAAKGVTDVLATAAGEAAAVAVQRAADEGKPPTVAQAAGRAAGEAAARGLTSVEAEAAGVRRGGGSASGGGSRDSCHCSSVGRAQGCAGGSPIESGGRDGPGGGRCGREGHCRRAAGRCRRRRS